MDITFFVLVRVSKQEEGSCLETLFNVVAGGPDCYIVEISHLIMKDPVSFSQRSSLSTFLSLNVYPCSLALLKGAGSRQRATGLLLLILENAKKL